MLSLIIAIDLSASNNAIKENRELMHRLDTVVRNHQHYISIKEHEISGLRESLAKAKKESDKIGVIRMLCDAYLVYNADSALYYASLYGDMLSRVNSEDMNEIAEWRLNEANIYAIMWLFDDAEKSMTHIDVSRLDRDMKIRYFQTMEYIYSLQWLYASHTKSKSEELDRKGLAMIDSLKSYGVTSENLWVGLAAYVRYRSKHKPADEEIAYIRKQVDSNKVSSRRNAINAYWLSRYYEKMGDDTNMMKYLIVAAINDAEIENREVAALQDLAIYLYRHGDVKRAYDYLSYCSDIANAYQNRNRMVSISNVFPEVRNAYKNDIDRRDRQLVAVTVLMALLLVALIMSLVFLALKIRKVRKTQKEVESLNKQLHAAVLSRDDAISELRHINEKVEENNRTLEEANSRLTEANGVIRGMLAMAFRLNSDYIADFDTFRKKMLRKFRLKKFDEAKMDLDDPLIIDSMHEIFNRELDNTILSVFPNFVTEYNALVSEESKADSEAIEKSKTLTTKMRIYAIRRLGVDKSADIARMLNISIRTVYNNKI